MRAPRKNGLLLLAILVLHSAGCNREKITLKLNLAKGETRSLSYNMDMTNKVSARNQKITMNMNMGIDLSFAVQDVNPQGLHDIKVTYDRLKFRMSGGPVNMAYDSESSRPADNPLAKVFSAMVGESLSMKMTSIGEIEEVSGFEQIAEKIAKQIPGSAAQMKQQLQSTKEQLGQMVATFPEKPVGVGSKWYGTIHTSTDPNMPMTIDLTYKIKKRVDGVATIQIRGKIKSDVGLKGSMNGEMRLEENTGWTLSADLDMKLYGKVQGANMDMDAKITVGGK